MKPYIRFTLITLTLLILLPSGIFLKASQPATEEKTDNTAAARLNSDTMHPAFVLPDQRGEPATASGAAASGAETCGQCHDSRYINKHNIHFNPTVKTDCFTCHVVGGAFSGDPALAHQQVGPPTAENCAICHGIINTGKDPVEIPADYETNAAYRTGDKYYNITRNTGVILSHQNISDSLLNIENKKEQDYAWDIHTRRQVDCIACHYAKNDPRYFGTIDSDLDHLKRDPRRSASLGSYLKRPDHRLQTASCTLCHNPFAIHKEIPYRTKHMKSLSCQACHVPVVYGPALQSVDETVLTVSGNPRTEYRGTDNAKTHGNSPNTRFFQGYTPPLFPHRQPLESRNAHQKNNADASVISPFNLVTHWQWVSAPSNEPVDAKTLEAVFLEGSGHHPDVVKLLDADGDGRLSESELVLDTAAKKESVKILLERAGVVSPEIRGTIRAHRITHGIAHGKRVSRECASCHNREKRFGDAIVLADRAPAGVTPEYEAGFAPMVEGRLQTPDGQVVLHRSPMVKGHYIFGHGRDAFSDKAGLIMLAMAFLFVVTHGGMRFLNRNKHKKHHIQTQTVYMYTIQGRLWHWTMALGVIILALTGLEIHYTGTFNLFGLVAAVHIHNALAAVLVLNAALALFLHLATGEIKQFFGFNRKFVHETLVQAFYYSYGIFKGAPHPIHKSLDRKLNPLQQMTYIVLLNVLMPFQILTGILMAFGFTALAPFHNLASWMFIAFMVAHVYLTTTGFTITDNIKAMITGYDEVPVGNHPQGDLIELGLKDLMKTLFKSLKSPQAYEYDTTHAASGSEDK